MQLKSGIVALSAIATLVFLGGSTAEAKTAKTEKTSEKNIVKVESGDSLSSIADDEKTTFVRIFNANKSIKNPNVVNVGDKLRIPDDDEKLANRYAKYEAAAVSVAPVTQPTTQTYQPAQSNVQQPTSYAANGSSAGNTYYQGYCTWYVKNKRPDLPNMLGNGGSWSANAAAQGMSTGSKAKAGAVAEQAGHVAYVESVNSDGTVTVSEMNYTGFNQTSSRTVPASTFNYIY